jgi:hypothetical protein
VKNSIANADARKRSVDEEDTEFGISGQAKVIVDVGKAVVNTDGHEVKQWLDVAILPTGLDKQGKVADMFGR